MQSNRAGDLALIEAPLPQPGPGQLRLAVRAVGICGSDVSAAQAKPNFDWVPRPLVLGHEFSGVVDAAGAGVKEWEPGQRVSALSVQGCGGCRPCRAGNTQQCPDRAILGLSIPGAMADYCLVDAAFAVPLHDGLSHLEGALVEPLAVACRCVRQGCKAAVGDRVVVSGCGIIGLLCALVARACGAEVTVTGIAADAGVRLRNARDLGMATVVVSEAEPLARQLSEPADILIEASGAPGALAAASEAIRPGGLIGVVATYPGPVFLPATDLVRREQRLHTSFGSTREDYEQAMAHLAAGDIPVKKLIETFALDEALAAFEASISKATTKAVLIP